MALSKLEPDKDRVEEIAQRMKEIIETTWLRDPNLNKETAEEYQLLRKEIEDMGMHVEHETKLNLEDSSGPKLEAEITIWIPKNITIQ
ncbi:MAG: hypothetical protein A3I26_02335 [Candidatus Yanofskybacteria bacterium RIFCSPLOWO2_02_FULL_43_10]|uniref:Uncharacterized protein n=1 Tax=Candidatus Yanofskybacteria bacterium RIFCSPLOWO2_12_FULL_43_11b TaxID=1802710 RepID=A0A1F8H9L2_9BACT|nr:MAG: hypothetical protein A2742_03800 [Candidatus Yanofskybacteria bacterium RIFCSPHIGHO2_01_FULL_43_32]OGN11099.1 MAG: hypothetical protein A3C69_00220 [Candidatus Yanofskybacteria bacterium RIFCSPHIGHO2_02_FULL_43_12]OGN17238.1 MAG: hypothetical protein A3E34_00070 [Candidatus Yanofskybacteria bacterium RIFCSPHIGHO2_12_FULL_43_11]OGN24969.1 MAG: hypothetical protein A2923_03300 [Candidatus Yanofskybacteria bacterium RIFCSPLOWO2_01_FULL_43_46]OGN30130.1 MAG: hypothetical protein A3I26_02335